MSSIPVTDPSVDPRAARSRSVASSRRRSTRRRAAASAPAAPAPPSVCAAEEPVLRELGGGQFVACHHPVETLPTGEHVGPRCAAAAPAGVVNAWRRTAGPRSGDGVGDGVAEAATGAPAARQGGDPAGRRAVMGEDGYEGASVRDMAARAGVSVAAIYYHFPSKSDLLREFLDEAWEMSLARVERHLRAGRRRPPHPARRDRRARSSPARSTTTSPSWRPTWRCATTRASTRPSGPPIAKKHKRMRTMLEKVLAVGRREGCVHDGRAQHHGAGHPDVDQLPRQVAVGRRPLQGRGHRDHPADGESARRPERSVVDRSWAAAAAGDGVTRDRRRPW